MTRYEVRRGVAYRHEHFAGRHVQRVGAPTATAAVTRTVALGPGIGAGLLATRNGEEAPQFETAALLIGQCRPVAMEGCAGRYC